MNANRRKQIAEVLNEIADLRSRIDSVKSDEQDAFDNMPEGLQQSDRGQKAEEACSCLDNVLSAFDEIESDLNTAME